MNKKNELYVNFYKRWQEVVEVPTQNLGPLTPLYKKYIPYFKNAPWKILVPLAIILIAVIFFVLEWTASGVTSVLQRAF